MSINEDFIHFIVILIWHNIYIIVISFLGKSDVSDDKFILEILFLHSTINSINKQETVYTVI